jgi:hypothetical protein
MSDKCPFCNEEMFPVFFGDDKMYENVEYKRCMSCNKIVISKKDGGGSYEQTNKVG